MTSAPPTFLWSDAARGTEPVFVSRCASNGPEPHDHDFMELAIVLAGTAIHSCPDGPSRLSVGSAILLRPGIWHSYLEAADLEVLNFCFPLSLAGDLWRHVVGSRVRSVLRSGEGVRIAALPFETVQALDGLERVGRHSTGELGLVMWALDQFAASIDVPPSGHPAVDHAIALLESTPQRAWSADDLAGEVGLDKAYLSRLFKAQAGVGPMTYLAGLRIERAASLLKGADMNCGEVGVAVGYADATVFGRRFRARFGMSPSEYRQRFRF